MNALSQGATGMRNLPPSTAPDASRSVSLMSDARTLAATAWSLDRRSVLVQLTLLALNGVAGGVGLALLVPIVNSIAGPTRAVTVSVLGTQGTGDSPLWVLLVGFVVLVATAALIQRTSTVHSARLQQRVVDRLRHDAFAAVLNAEWSFVVGMRRSDVIQVVTTGAARSGLAVHQLCTVAVSLVLAIATAAIAVAVDPVVATVAMAGVVAMAVAQSCGIRPAHRLGQLLGARSRELQAVVTDSLDSLRLARAHDAPKFWLDRLAMAFGDTGDLQLANAQRMSTLSALTSVGGAAAAAALVGLAVWAGSEPAAVALVVVLLGRLRGQVDGVVRNSTLLANSLPAVGDIIGLTIAARSASELPETLDARESARESSDGAGRVVGGRRRSLTVADGAPLLEFREVGFTYPSSGGGIRHLDLVVRRGRITALTGPSGSGKSTTADLALGLLRPDVGQVLLDGQPLEAGDLAWWRSHIAYVPQDPLLLPGSLRDNLVWSVQHAVTDDDCKVALAQAAAHFAMALPDGLDTRLGDRGVSLSGGERQRVAIARALLRKPALLVLDEATSALDDDTEAEVLDTIASLVPAVTVLVIAHRRTTLERAHHVVRVGAGVMGPGRRAQ